MKKKIPELYDKYINSLIEISKAKINVRFKVFELKIE